MGFSYSFLHADGTRGGILVAWQTTAWPMSQVHMSTHSLSLKMKQLVVDLSWWISVVYGPHGDQEKLQFLEELRVVRAAHTGP
jgi:hypothetical protein